jgi:hypothetical protein
MGSIEWKDDGTVILRGTIAESFRKFYNELYDKRNNTVDQIPENRSEILLDTSRWPEVLKNCLYPDSNKLIGSLTGFVELYCRMITGPIYPKLLREGILKDDGSKFTLKSWQNAIAEAKSSKCYN